MLNIAKYAAKTLLIGGTVHDFKAQKVASKKNNLAKPQPTNTTSKDDLNSVYKNCNYNFKNFSFIKTINCISPEEQLIIDRDKAIEAQNAANEASQKVKDEETLKEAEDARRKADQATTNLLDSVERCDDFRNHVG